MHPFYRPYVISDKPFTLLTECSPIKKTISISTGPISLANDKKSGNLNLNHYQCACIKPFISSILHLKSCSCIQSHHTWGKSLSAGQRASLSLHKPGGILVRGARLIFHHHILHILIRTLNGGLVAS